MKNILVIGVVSLVLFSVSAALSVWLQSNKKTETTASGDEKTPNKKTPVDPKAGHAEPTPPGTPDTGLKPFDPGPKAVDDRSELRRIQMEVIQKEMRMQNEEISKRLKQLTVELKALQADAEANDAQAKKVKERDEQITKRESELAKKATTTVTKAGYVQLADLMSQMEPAEVAKIVIQKADEGKLDEIVRALVPMKPTKLTKILLELKDTELEKKILDRYGELTSEKATASK